MSKARGDATLDQIAIDGKTLKGSWRLDAKVAHVLAAIATDLADLTVEPDQNEITSAMVLLKGLPLEGAIRRRR